MRMIRTENLWPRIRRLGIGKVIGELYVDAMPPLMALALRLPDGFNAEKHSLGFTLCFDVIRPKQEGLSPFSDLRLWLKHRAKAGLDGSKPLNIELELEVESAIDGGTKALEAWLSEVFDADELEQLFKEENVL